MGRVSDDQRALIIDDHKCGEELKANFIIGKEGLILRGAGAAEVQRT